MTVMLAPSTARFALESDAFPVVAPDRQPAASRPAPGPDAVRKVTALAELYSARIASSTQLLAPMPEDREQRAREILARMTPSQLLEAQVLAGHVVTAIVRERRRKETESG